MIIIAHRGLVSGPDPHLENQPQQITQLLQAGWHVEIDVRFSSGAWYLGHDAPVHKVDVPFLTQPNLWIHVKDVAAANQIREVHDLYPHLNFFWHESDARVLTSQGHWWTQPGHDLVSNSVAVMPEWHVNYVRTCLKWPCLAVCTDWGSQLQ